MDVWFGFEGLYLFTITLWILITLREIIVSKLHGNRGDPLILLYTATTLFFVLGYLWVSFPTVYLTELFANWVSLVMFFGFVICFIVFIVLAVKYEQKFKQTRISRLSNAINAVDETESLTLLEVLIDYPRFWAKLIKRYGIKKAAMIVAAVAAVTGFLLVDFFFIFLPFSPMWIWYTGFLVLIGILVGWAYHHLTKTFTKASRNVEEELHIEGDSD